jgi:hypothetical protein
VLITGDLNCKPQDGVYPALAYSAVKAHALKLRSVYNDDLELILTEGSALEVEGVYSTWKARCAEDGGEVVSKHCIDYLLYRGLRLAAVLDVYRGEDLGDALLPSASYPSDHLAIAADFIWE